MASTEHQALTARLADAGFIAASDEAADLIAAARGDAERLERLASRRLTGEPFAWITGRARFCGIELRVKRGVYVPRWHSEPLAKRAAERLPAKGVAIDICTGSGAIAKVLAEARPGARVIATDTDERAVACAKANGVEVYRGDLFRPLDEALMGAVDVVVGVVPYVPTGSLELLQRDTLTFESPGAYDGGPDGTDVLRRAIAGAGEWLRPAGALLLELGGHQAELLKTVLAEHGFRERRTLTDDEGDVRGIEATLGS